MDNNSKKLTWQNLALMAFVSVWGFGNIVNNYANQGLTVITSWILIIALYFVPYVLMVGELGASFKDSNGGVSSWVRHTMGPTLAYLAGWTYWVVHIPYLAQKPQGVLVALSWAIFQDGNTIKNMDSLTFQLICLLVFLFFLWVASRGLNSLKKIGAIAGTSMFVMSILYIVLMLAAPAIAGVKIATTNITLKSFIPDFNFAYFTTISMLVFAVGGCEKMSPYVNSLEKPSKEFPRGMIVLAIMVAVTALLGSFAMGMMFDANNIPSDLKMNGAYYSFQKLGEYYHVGNLFLILYALANLGAQVSALVFSIDAPLKVLLADADLNYIPKALAKKTKNGTLINGYIMTAILVSILIVVPALGSKDTNNLYNLILDLNSVVMPLRYLWVFAAYMILRRKYTEKYNSEYKFIKNSKAAYIAGLWCFLFTAFACIMGMFPKAGIEKYSSEWIFQFVLNLGTPFILIGLGLILPKIAKRNKNIDKTGDL